LIIKYIFSEKRDSFYTNRFYFDSSDWKLLSSKKPSNIIKDKLVELTEEKVSQESLGQRLLENLPTNASNLKAILRCPTLDKTFEIKKLSKKEAAILARAIRKKDTYVFFSPAKTYSQTYLDILINNSDILLSVQLFLRNTSDINNIKNKVRKIEHVSNSDYGIKFYFQKIGEELEPDIICAILTNKATGPADSFWDFNFLNEIVVDKITRAELEEYMYYSEYNY
jgi:predicted transport protein